MYKRKLQEHKNLFNGDCNFFFYTPDMFQPEGGSYSAKAIHNAINMLALNGVDTFINNPNGQIAAYPSRVWPTNLDIINDNGKSASDQDSMCRLYKDLVDAGVDWVGETAIACQKAGISPWLSIRMNDMHITDINDPFSGLLKHKEYLLRGTCLNPKEGINNYWRGLNYAFKEVRDHYFKLIKELVEDYDYEGIELDWLRNPLCCEPEASQETIGIITEWIAEIRELTRKKSEKTGLPYAVGLRLPANLEIMRDIGLDVKEIVSKGLIDFVGFGNFLQNAWETPFDKLREELGNEITIYGVLDNPGNWTKIHSSALNMEVAGTTIHGTAVSEPMLRGAAAAKLVFDIDGIEQFNFFCPDHGGIPEVRSNYKALYGIHNLEVLRGKPKHYLLSSRQFIPFDIPEQVPSILEPGWRKAFRIPMCKEPEGSKLGVIIQVIIRKNDYLPDVGVSFNGTWPNFESSITDHLLFEEGISFTKHAPEHIVFNFSFSIDKIKEGWNEIIVYNGNYKNTTLDERIQHSICIEGIEAGIK